jgi:PDZ domain-containing secreted protein
MLNVQSACILYPYLTIYAYLTLSLSNNADLNRLHDMADEGDGDKHVQRLNQVRYQRCKKTSHFSHKAYYIAYLDIQGEI